MNPPKKQATAITNDPQDVLVSITIVLIKTYIITKE